MPEKIPRDDPRAAHMSSDVHVDAVELARIMAGRNHWVLATSRRDRRPQMSLVTGGMTPDGILLVSTYPERIKARNLRRDPHVSVLAMGAKFDDAWIQIDGSATVVDMPAAADLLVDYYRCISGEHPDWDEYRDAMTAQGKSVLRIVPQRWSPLSKGGFPPSLFEG
jgi:PPOX class probable F420-dependent enzyme